MLFFIRTGALFLVLFFYSSLHAQRTSDDLVSKDIIMSWQTGNGSTLSEHFPDLVDLNIEGKDGRYSKAQARQIIIGFMRKLDIKGFTVTYQGQSKEGNPYVIGSLQTQSGTYRVYYVLRTISHQLYLGQIQIEKE